MKLNLKSISIIKYFISFRWLCDELASLSDSQETPLRNRILPTLTRASVVQNRAEQPQHYDLAESSTQNNFFMGMIALRGAS